ncbi:MAG: GntR family transcriptional regulator, partial [Gemmobacter sp.]
MPRAALWTAIAETLRGEIAQGLYPPGARLPTEAALSARFGVNRHTVRHALAALAQDGTVHARRGAGVFVTARPTDYPLGQ